MNPSALYLTAQDYRLVNQLLVGPTGKNVTIDRLRAELARAVVLEPSAVPAAAVGLNSLVRFEDLGSREEEEYQVTLPADADPDQRRISVLSPIGAALLGYCAGQEIEWPTPGGLRRLRILRVRRETPVGAVA
ncbi:MAG: GreA/GreB family elongation factor [Opitutaceae bacterium]|nr:GreA/GreB family elongation factor [Opitutaceae bacterium]